MDQLIQLFSFLLRSIRNPDELIKLSGYPLLVLALIVFLETGAMVFFLPGDSLLVTAGLYAARGSFDLLTMNLILVPMAILGDALSYFIGLRAGPHLFNRPRSRFFNPQHLRDAHEFYERHGGKAIILARFVPLLRTFVPVVAGVAQMTYRRFASYNVVGGAAWVVSMTCTGYFLGSFFERLFGIKIERHIEKLIIIVVFLSILPGIIAFLKARRDDRRSSQRKSAEKKPD
jgi:membrane-associated protein